MHSDESSVADLKGGVVHVAAGHNSSIADKNYGSLLKDKNRSYPA